MSTKIPVREIYLSRIEGEILECRDKTVKSWDDADKHFREWGYTAPGPGNDYHKVDFTITFEDGVRYFGRFDLKLGGRDDGSHTLSQHVRNHIDITAGVRPYWCSDEAWDAIQKMQTDQEKYDIPPIRR